MIWMVGDPDLYMYLQIDSIPVWELNDDLKEIELMELSVYF